MADILMLQKAAFRLASWQALLTGMVAAGAFWFSGSSAALSALTGGSIGIVAGLYQALRMFRVNAALDPEGFMCSIYIGEAVKIVLTVALMIAAITVPSISSNFLPSRKGRNQRSLCLSLSIPTLPELRLSQKVAASSQVWVQ